MPATMPATTTKVEIDPSKYITNMRRAKFWLPRTAQWLRKVSTLVNGAKFDLDIWGRASGVPSDIKEASICGFEGCALGWAALEPRHRKAGLRLEVEYGRRLEITFLSDTCSSAACAFYGLQYSAVRTLFGTASIDWQGGDIQESEDDKDLIDRHDPIAAAERIERFCNDMGIALLEDQSGSELE